MSVSLERPGPDRALYTLRDVNSNSVVTGLDSWSAGTKGNASSRPIRQNRGTLVNSSVPGKSSPQITVSLPVLETLLGFFCMLSDGTSKEPRVSTRGSLLEYLFHAKQVLWFLGWPVPHYIAFCNVLMPKKTAGRLPEDTFLGSFTFFSLPPIANLSLRAVRLLYHELRDRYATMTNAYLKGC